MNKKVIIISLLGIGLFLLGIIMNFIFSNSHEENSSSESSSYKTPTKIQKEHCLEDICIKSMKITIKDGNSYITGIIINNSVSDLSNGTIDLNFALTDGRSIIQTYSYVLLQSKIEIPFNMTIPTEDILIATDYKIKKTQD